MALPGPSLTREGQLCPEGCQKGSFKRQYELQRHIREQHRCPHRECKDLKFTQTERKVHEEIHPIAYKCGSCELMGLKRKPPPRMDKLRMHFRNEHNVPAQFDCLEFQCRMGPCYAGCGGTFFVSRTDLLRHVQSVHANLDLEIMRPVHSGDVVSAAGGKPSDTGPEIEDLPHVDGESQNGTTTNSLVMSRDNTGVSNQKRRLASATPSTLPSSHKENSHNRLNYQTPKRQYRLFPAPSNKSSFDTASSTHPTSRNTRWERTVGGSMTMAELRDLCKQHGKYTNYYVDQHLLTSELDFEEIIHELSEHEVSVIFSLPKNSIVLRATCSLQELDILKVALEALVGRVTRSQKGRRLARPHRHSARQRFQHSTGHRLWQRIFPFEASAPEDEGLLSIWDRHIVPNLPDIVDILPIRGTWSVDLVRLEVKAGHTTPYIRFQSSDGQSLIVRETIRDRIGEIFAANYYPAVPVQFSTGTIERLVRMSSDEPLPDEPFPDELSNDATFRHHSRYWRTPGMGASIGMSQCAHISATLGGYILIDGQKHMLSVKHFIDVAGTCQYCSAEPQSPNVSPLELCSPSLEDVHAMKDQCQAKIDNLDYSIRQQFLEDELEILKLSDIINGRLGEELAQYREFLRQLDADTKAFTLGELEKQSTEPSRLSRLHADRSLPHAMDWAVFHVIQPRQGMNRHRYSGGREPTLGELKEEIIKMGGTGEDCCAAREFEENEEVHWVGNFSGYRTGKVNGAPAFLHLAGHNTVEWTIIPSEPVTCDEVAGDSGAWVIGHDNKLIGLLWGYLGGLLVFTPIKDVFDDIRDAFGAQDVKVAPPPGRKPRGPAPRVIPLCRLSSTQPLKKRRSLILSSIKTNLADSEDRLPSTLPLRLQQNHFPSPSEEEITPDHIEGHSPSPTPSLTSTMSTLSETPSPEPLFALPDTLRRPIFSDFKKSGIDFHIKNESHTETARVWDAPLAQEEVWGVSEQFPDNCRNQIECDVALNMLPKP